MDLSRHKYSSALHFGHKWPLHFGCASGFLKLCNIFLDEALFHDMAHISGLPLLGYTQVFLGIFSSCVAC
jgi:hypothetical protein